MITSEKVRRFIKLDADQINGWFFQPDMLTFAMIDAIQKRRGVVGSLCELGVFEGKSLVLLSHFLREGEALHGFDLFPGDQRDKALRNLRAYGNPHNVHLVTGDCAELRFDSLKQVFGSNGLRMLHIDAGHEYHEVLHQLALFAPFVQQGGCIIMDDYQNREFPGIVAAVLDFAEWDRPRRFVPFFVGANKTYVCERAHSAPYQRLLLEYKPVRDKSRVTRVRDFTVLVGFSNLPVLAAECRKIIDALEFPQPYVASESALARDAAQFARTKFGRPGDYSGKAESEFS